VIEQILDTLRAQGKYLMFAESLTGGLLVDRFVSVAGASEVVLGSEVTYSESLKIALLGVEEDTLEAKSAVSREVAIQMAKGALAVACGSADLESTEVIAMSTTGNAGPMIQGDESVGTVFVALATGLEVKVHKLQLAGDRNEIRNQTCDDAVEFLREHLGL